MSDCPGCGSHQLQNCLPGCDGETRHPRIDWKARAERAEAGWRETERELRDDRRVHLAERAELRRRAEQAEALLREAQTEMDAGGYWASQVWRAKVRALLEGTT